VGQQQLLLVILGAIIIGIAVTVGITIFKANSTGQNRDAVWTNLNTLAARAQQYYRKPRALGGGDRSFVGFTISAKEANNDNGYFTIVGSPTATQVVIKGQGAELGEDPTRLVELNMVVQPDTMYIDMALGYN
jgi:hypothetical protein